MFHQSLDGIAKYPPAEALTDIERLKFCDLEFYKLMQVVMIADSASYTFFSEETTSKGRKEFLMNSKKMMQAYTKGHKRQ